MFVYQVYSLWFNKLMCLLPPKFFRVLVCLLITVFISESVYASSMMLAVLNPDFQSTQRLIQPIQVSENQTTHCHEMQDNLSAASPSHEYLVHKNLAHENQAHGQQKSHASCTHCNHCLACFPMIPQGQFTAFILQAETITAVTFVEIYHSPSSVQPQKPPIV